jgi:hypothetical protein
MPTTLEKRTFLLHMKQPEFRNKLRRELLDQLAQLDKLEEQLAQLPADVDPTFQAVEDTIILASERK